MTRVLGLLMLFAATRAPARAGEPVALFDGKDTDKWYTFLRDHGKDKDPNGNFTVRDGILRISGQDFGGVITPAAYAHHRGRSGDGPGGRSLCRLGHKAPGTPAPPPP